MDDEIVIKFWGVRGTLPVTGQKAVRYGGNTNCVTLDIAQQCFIFDAGTGFKALSDHIIKENRRPLSAKIFITHPHYDHLHGFPFFIPLYNKENSFEIYGTDIESLISHQIDNIYFPITIKSFAAQLKFHNIKEVNFYIDDINIQTLILNHPGKALGYRVQYKNKIFCYITDNELYLEDSPSYCEEDVNRLINFIFEADAVVIDTTYFDEEYVKKINWGHSCVSRVVDVVNRAKVKLMCLHHHDPDQTDDDIDKKLVLAKELLKSLGSTTNCVAPREGDSITI